MNALLSRSSIRCVFSLLLASLALLWPALLNGGPFWHPDSSNYIRAADAAVVYASGARSEWSDKLTDAPNVESASTRPGGEIEIVPNRTVYSGRSIYYGFFIYLPMLVLGVWGSLFVQALVVVGISWFVGSIVARELRLKAARTSQIIFVAIASASPLPYYTSMLMPDVFSGLLILTLVTAVSLYRRTTPLEKFGLLAASALFATFHTTHILITGAVMGGALLGCAVRRIELRAAALMLPVIAVGLASTLIFNSAVAAVLDREPLSPPFLTARLTAAGPGLDYLKRACIEDEQPFLLCRYQDRLPLESDSFLWDENTRTGLFQTLRPEEQFILASEDRKFFIATLVDDPVAFTTAAGIASLEQAVSFDLKNFNYPAVQVQSLFDKYPLNIALSIERTRAAQGRMPVEPTVWASVLSCLASLVIIFSVYLSSLRPSSSRRLPAYLWWFVLLVLAGVISNAVICGALSGPHARYQMRLIWILPFAATLLMAAARRAGANSSQSAEPLRTQ